MNARTRLFSMGTAALLALTLAACPTSTGSPATTTNGTETTRQRPDATYTLPTAAELAGKVLYYYGEWGNSAGEWGPNIVYMQFDAAATSGTLQGKIYHYDYKTSLIPLTGFVMEEHTNETTYKDGYFDSGDGWGAYIYASNGTFYFYGDDLRLYEAPFLPDYELSWYAETEPVTYESSYPKNGVTETTTVYFMNGVCKAFSSGSGYGPLETAYGWCYLQDETNKPVATDIPNKGNGTVTVKAIKSWNETSNTLELLDTPQVSQVEITNGAFTFMGHEFKIQR